ncbi:putative Helicase ATP-binding domain-containing protein [Seiridium unicorne]|uniref:Helicase ATP-binding domain-containing protein n=1 Tax=Seiridium unicorne TaxID=138068 RepID=A0ABR2V901_9PEZI
MELSDSWKSEETTLRSEVARNGVTVTYVQGPYGSGKSTTMLLELSRRFLEIYGDGGIMYVYPGGERNGSGILGDRALFEQFSEVTKLSGGDILKPVGAGGKHLELYSYRLFTEAWENERAKERNTFGKPAIVFWDLEILPTHLGEIAMGGLVHSAILASGHSPQRVAIFILAGHLSKRTLEVFQRRLGKPTYIKFDQKRPNVQWRIQEDEEGSAKWLPKQALGTDAAKCVARVGLPGPYSNQVRKQPDCQAIEAETNESVHALWEEGLKGIRKLQGLDSTDRPQYVTVAHDVSWSTHLKGLTMLYSPKHVGDLLLDRKNCQLLAKERVLTRSELDRLHSWASKSVAVFGQTVEIIAPYSREEMESFPDNPDSFGSAWTVICCLRSYGSMSYGMGGTSLIFPSGVLLVGKNGYVQRKYLLSLDVFSGICSNWNSAMLLALAREKVKADQSDTIVPRILSTMAALLEGDSVSSFFEIDQDWFWPVGQERQAACDGPATYHAYAGSLWLSTGILCKIADTPMHDIMCLEGHITVHSGRAKVPESGALFACREIKLETDQLRSWSRTPRLTREEFSEMNLALAQAFLFQLLFFGPRPDDLSEEGGDDDRIVEVLHCHSGRPVRVRGAKLVIELWRVWNANPLGFYAFYSGPLRLDEDGVPTTDEVTYVSTAALYSMAEAQNQRWPDMAEATAKKLEGLAIAPSDLARAPPELAHAPMPSVPLLFSSDSSVFGPPRDRFQDRYSSNQDRRCPSN